MKHVIQNRRFFNLKKMFVIMGLIVSLISGCGGGDDNGVNPESPKNYVITNSDDLASVSGLKIVTGNLTIEKSVDLTTLVGLDSLTEIQGNLFIESNYYLRKSGWSQ